MDGPELQLLIAVGVNYRGQHGAIPGSGSYVGLLRLCQRSQTHFFARTCASDGCARVVRRGSVIDRVVEPGIKRDVLLLGTVFCVSATCAPATCASATAITTTGFFSHTSTSRVFYLGESFPSQAGLAAHECSIWGKVHPLNSIWGKFLSSLWTGNFQ